MANAVDLKSTAGRLVGSNPTTPTNLFDMYLRNEEILTLQHELDTLCAQDPNFVTQGEAAELLSVSRQFVLDLVKRGVLFGVSGKTAWVFVPSINDRLEYIKKHGKPTRGGTRKKGITQDNVWLKKVHPELFIERAEQ